MTRFLRLLAPCLAIGALVSVTSSQTASAVTRAKIDPNATLTVAFPTDPLTRDPRITVATAYRDLVVQIFDGLVSKDWYGNRSGKNLKIIPALASSWKVTNGGKTYTFFLRRTVKFHDGTPFNAQAVVFNFRTWLDKGFKYYYPKAALANASFNAHFLIKNFRALGPYTFQLNLNRPFAGLLDKLAAATTTFMVSPAAIETYGNEGINDHPIGTGPFRFVSYTPGQAIVLARNDRYFRGRAKIKNLVLQIIPDQSARAAALEAHQVQIAQGLSIQQKQAWAGRSDIHLIVGPRPLTYMCWLNVKEGPLANPLAREAVSLAVNRQEINSLVFAGQTSPASGFFTPGMLSYDPSLPPLAYNPTKAKQLLAKAGYPNGFTINFQATTNANEPQIYNVVQQNLKAVGITLNMSYSTIGTFLSTEFLPGIKPGSGVDGNCLGSGAEDDDFFALYFTKEYGWPTIGGYDTNWFYSAKVDGAVNKAFSAQSPAGYVANLRAANKALVNSYSVLFTVRDLNIYGVASNVSWTPAVRLRPTYYTAAVLK